MGEGMCAHCGYALAGGTCDNGCNQSMPTIYDPVTNQGVESLILCQSSPQSANKVRRLDVERKRLLNAIEGKKGWREENEQQQQRIAELEGEVKLARKQRDHSLLEVAKCERQAEDRIAELEAEVKRLQPQLSEAIKARVLAVERVQELEAERDLLREERDFARQHLKIRKECRELLENNLEAAVADNAVLLESLRETCLEGEGPSFCIWCGFPRMSGHAENCLLEQDNPGEALLKRIAALERVAEAYRNHEGHECESPRCGCGEVCQDCQEVIEALDELDKTKGG